MSIRGSRGRARREWFTPSDESKASSRAQRNVSLPHIKETQKQRKYFIEGLNPFLKSSERPLRMEKKNMPAEHPPLDGYSMDDLRSACPAFQRESKASASTGGTGECPFAHMQTPSQRKELSKCPAFSQGCPFKGVRTVDELYQIFSSMPSQHTGEVGAAGSILQQMLHGVHQRSAELAKEHGACPVFSNE